jgi:hypothetical protein
LGVLPLYEYEAWLDVLDGKMYAKDGWLISELGDTFKIPISEVDSPDKLFAMAVKFRASIGDEVRSDEWYLLRRFYGLLNQEHRYDRKFRLSGEKFEAKLNVGWQAIRKKERKLMKRRVAQMLILLAATCLIVVLLARG